jgi:hypothetical protein
VFYFDAYSIGNTRSDNWQFIVETMAAFLTLGVVTVLVSAPFSIIECSIKEEDWQNPLVIGNNHVPESL